MEWNCAECRMKFYSLTSYEKHKRKFCSIGRESDKTEPKSKDKYPKPEKDPRINQSGPSVAEPHKNVLKSSSDQPQSVEEDWRKRAARDIDEKLYLASMKKSPLLLDASDRATHAKSAKVLNRTNNYMDKMKEIAEIHNSNSKDLKERNKKLQEQKAWIMEQMALAKVTENNNERIPSPAALERKEKELEEMKRRLAELEKQWSSLPAHDSDEDLSESYMMTPQQESLTQSPSLERKYSNKAIGTDDHKSIRSAQPMNKNESPSPSPQSRISSDDSRVSSSKSLGVNELKTPSQLGLDPLDPSPYDPRAGFGIFWDYVLGLDMTSTKCQLTMSLYMGPKAMTNTKPLPPSECFLLPLPHYTAALSGKAAKIARRTPFPKCLPNQAIYVIVELKVNHSTGSHPEEMSTVGWTKIDLFDFKNRLVSGRWKVPVRILPIQPELSQRDLNKIDQLGHAEIYFRLVNARDIKNEEQFPVQPQNSYLYKFLQEGYARLLGQSPLSFHRVPTVSLTDTDSLHQISKMRLDDSSLNQEEEPHTSYSKPSSCSNVSGEEEFVGFQIDKVSFAGDFEGIVKLSLVGPDGQVLQSDDGSLVSFTTDPSKPSFLTGISAFGLDEHEFKGVKWNTKSVVLVEFTKLTERTLQPRRRSSGTSQSKEETLIGWTTLPLADLPRPFSSERSLQASRVPTAVSGVEPMLHTGYHELPLFQPPIVNFSKVPLNKDVYPSSWSKLGNATVTIFIYDNSLYSAIQPAPIARYKDKDEVSTGTFIDHQQIPGSNTAYEEGDGFDLYIDGARFLPDCVGLTKVVGGVLDESFKRYEDDIVIFGQLDSDTTFPDFDHHMEFRHVPNMNPSATLYLRVYIVDTILKQQFPLGCTGLPIFLEKETLKQATKTHKPHQVCLNEGAHQIRLYYGCLKMKETLERGDILSIQTLQKLSPFPCASLLVRIVRVPNHPNGRPKKRADFRETEWYKEGLLVPKPQYSTGAYYSSSSKPTLGEIQIFHDLSKSDKRSVRDAAKLVNVNNEDISTDPKIYNFIKTLFPRTETLDFNSNFLVQFNTNHGFKLSVDRAQNLPWSGFTVSSYCFLPPGAYFEGSRVDAMYFVYHLNFESQQKSPEWTDRLKQLPMRAFFPYLLIVFQLHEFTFTEVEMKLKLDNQAWCVLQLFTGEYCLNGAYQLPLYIGKPPKEVLEDMKNDLAQNVLREARRKSQVQILKGSSLLVRVCDARREDELKSPKESLISDPLPHDRKGSYTEVTSSQPLKSIVPHGLGEDRMIRLLRKALEEHTRAHLKSFSGRKISTASLLPPNIPQTPVRPVSTRSVARQPTADLTDY